jgi:hypothetical protein
MRGEEGGGKEGGYVRKGGRKWKRRGKGQKRDMLQAKQNTTQSKKKINENNTNVVVSKTTFPFTAQNVALSNDST